MSALDFYFDFSSSFSYIAAASIDEIAARYDWRVNWKPIALGAIFQARNHEIPAMGSAKQRYIWKDVERSALAAGLPYSWPSPFPFNSIPLARACIWLSLKDADKARSLAWKLFSILYAQDADTSEPKELLTLAATAIGLDSLSLLEGANDLDVKARLKSDTEAAIELGVFGAPTFVAGGELFWGADRLPQLERHLAGGGGQ